MEKKMKLKPDMPSTTFEMFRAVRRMAAGTAFLLFAWFANAQIPDANGIIYVKPAETGTGDGSSWANATADFKNAINVSGVTKVYAAIGYYRVRSVGMRNGVEIYGGFDPDNGITDLNNRILPNRDITDVGAYPLNCTVLDGWDGGSSYGTLFTNNGVNTTAVLDGVLIQSGDAPSTNGGGMRNTNASPTLRNIVFYSNMARRGGAMWNNGSSPVISNAIFLINASYGTVANNSQDAYGGAVYNSGSSSPVFTNTLFISNSTSVTSNGGGAVYHTGTGTAQFTNCTFDGNISNDWSKTAVEVDASASGTATFQNSIVYGSVTGNYTAQYSMIDGNTDFSNGNIDITGHSTTDIFVATTNLYSTSTGNYRPNSNVVINKGSNALYPSLSAVTKDLANNFRLAGATIDLGAYELNPVPDANGIIYVKPTATGIGSGSSWDDATGDLQGAINASGTQKVFVAVGNYNVGGNSFVMKNGVEIYGGFDPDNNIRTLDDARILPNKGTGDGSVLNGQNTRPVVWNYQNGVTNSAVLDGFTVTAGYNNARAAGILNYQTSPTLRNLVIKENHTNAEGAGIYNSDASPVISNVIIKENTAGTNGGGIYNTGTSAPELTNVLIAGNTATTSGGGVYIQTTSGTATLTNVTVADNSSNSVTVSSGNLNVNNSIVYGGITGTYAAQYSLVEGSANAVNGNINATGITLTDIFADAVNGNYTLKAASPAVDKGSNALFAGLGENTKDLAGNARVYDLAHGGKIDLGTYESKYTVGIVYVKTVATGTGDGSSWANATADIAGASQGVGITKVYVASGVYYKKFVGTAVLKNGVEFYGGFNPVNDETDWNTRYLPNKMTGNVGYPQGPGDDTRGSVLSAADWGVTGYLSQVITTSGLDNSAVLDGFSVMGADGLIILGGGISNINSSPTLRNLWITSNLAMRGSGIYNMNSSPVVTDVIFSYNYTGYQNENNMSQGQGGAIFNGGNSSPVFTNVLVITNGSPRAAANGGGGLYHSGTGTATFINCTFDNNVAGTNTYQRESNAVTVDSSASGTVSFINSIVFGGIVGNYTAQYSLIEGNTDLSNGNMDATGISPQDVFINPVANTSVSLGNYGPSYTSPVINAGSNALFPGLDANSTDIAGNKRLTDFNNTGLVIDLGAYESAYTPILPTAGIVYVRPTNYGNQDGSTWEDATNDLHRAIQTTGVSKVFVAVGNYNVGDNSFVMKNGVEIYGGFDPDNNIRTLDDDRIYPSLTVEGTVLDGQNARPVIWNVFDASTALDNTALLDGFTIKNGSYGGDGGGIRNIYASPVFNHLVIKNNRTTGYRLGGGVYNENSHPRFLNVVVTGNSADRGGGMYNQNTASVTCINYLSFGNTARSTIQGRSAEMISTGSGSTFINATIVGETRSDVYLGANDVLVNSVIPVGMNSSLVAPQLPVFKNSLVLGVVTGGANNNIDASGMALTDIFTDPANSDYTLKSISPAVNTGDNSLFPGLDGHTKDLLGNDRVFDFANGGTIDMGALESSSNHVYKPLAPDMDGIMYVRTTAYGDSTGSSWENATNRLQAAITTTDVQKVFVGSGTYHLFRELYMKDNVAIYGGFDPDNGIRTLGDPRILPDNSSTAVGSVLRSNTLVSAVRNFVNFLDSTAILDGFTITNSGGFGAISNNDASPTLRNLFITGNHSSANGGGIRNYSNASPKISNVVISGNAGQYGVGIFNGTNSSPVISNVVISGNSGQFGAGMYNDDNSNPVLTDVVFKDNIAAKDGGGMNNNNNSNPVMARVQFRNNRADYGGGIFNRNSSPTMANIEITDNTANRDAGGMYNDANSSPNITNLKLTGNTANNANGGGMYNRTNSSPVITNALIANNTAVTNGGAIRNEATSSPQLVNVTIVNNNGANTIYDNNGITSFANSIAFGTISGNYIPLYSMIEGNADFTNGNLDAGGITITDIFTNPTADNYTLKNSSPVIDAGSNALFMNLGTSSVDLAGNPRLYNDSIDLGAYEKQCQTVLSATDTRTECAPFRWIDGVEYFAANDTATFTLQSVNGCDSVVTLNLTINNPTHNAATETACESFNWNGSTYMASGTYTFDYTNTNGCPSTDTLHLTINNGAHNVDTETACESFDWNGSTYMASGTYTFDYTNTNGCLDTDTLHLTINATHNTATESACESYYWKGSTYTASGIYTFDYVNGNGCASRDTLHLTINNGTHDVITETECESFVWNDSTYKASGVYTFDYMNGSGCASTDTLHLTINNGTHDVITETECESFIWNDSTYTTSGVYTFDYINGNGCASTDTLHLTINNGTHNAITEAECESFIWNDSSYTTSGVYTFGYVNGNGCASTDTLYLTINNGTHDVITETKCESFIWNDSTYTTSGVYTFGYVNGNGCTSMDTLYLTIGELNALATVDGILISVNITDAAYQWIDCNNNNTPVAGAMTQTFTPAANGNYAVVVTKDGCSATSACVSILGVGVQETAVFRMEVFPNPNNGKFRIRTGGHYAQVTVNIYDVAGRKVYVRTHTAAQEMEVGETLPAGAYTVLLLSEGKPLASGKILVTK